ncbi:MAG: hypothetical protein WC719_04070 [Patescibacteria group bacterium]|jgi:hypothetical protein
MKEVADFQRKSPWEYRLAKIRAAWLILLGMASELILVIIVLSPCLTLYLLGSGYGGFLPLMTERDIAEFVVIKIVYALPPWWNFVFAFILAAFLYWMCVSAWFRRETGTVTRYLMIIIVAFLGSYYSVFYGGMLYGLVASVIFLILLVILILSSPWLSDLLFGDGSRI